jgi:NADPH:quinone reductase-like Zn-dependent oxidoreductase
VTLKVAAAPINPSDLLFARGQYGLIKPTPVTPGFEGTGTVVASGGGLYGKWLVGKRVACGAPPDGGGTWAEYVTTQAKLCMPLSRQVSDEQGAMALANPATAMALFHEAKDRGHKAAVHTAAAGALGRILLRIGVKNNYPIIHIVRRQEQVDLLKGLGGEFVLNSGSPEFPAALKETAGRLQATIAFDAVAGESTGQLVDALPKNSQILIYGALSLENARVDPKRMIFDNKQIEGWWFSDWMQKKGFLRSGGILRKALKCVGGEWATEVAGKVPLDDAHAAMLRYEEQMTRGKILIVP